MTDEIDNTGPTSTADQVSQRIVESEELVQLILY